MLSAHHSRFGLFDVFCVFHGEQNICDDGHNAGGRDRIVEDEADKAGEPIMAAGWKVILKWRGRGRPNHVASAIEDVSTMPRAART